MYDEYGTDPPPDFDPWKKDQFKEFRPDYGDGGYKGDPWNFGDSACIMPIVISIGGFISLFLYLLM